MIGFCIMMWFVEPKYRRKGIGSNILTKIVEKAKEKEYNIIMLNSSDMGKSLYVKKDLQK